MGARVLRGTLTIEANGMRIGENDLAAWLAANAGKEIILVAAPVGKSVVDHDIKTCYTCGREFKGNSCPHCAEVRARLRGF